MSTALEDTDDLRVIARVGTTFGLLGWVHLIDFGGAADQLAEGQAWWLSRSKSSLGGERPLSAFKCEGVRCHGSGLVAKLCGVDVREQAALLRGSDVAVPRSTFSALSSNEYYWADLLGLQVLNQAGENLGKITQILETGANAVLCVVDEKNTERLLPFVSAIVLRVDLSARCIYVEWELDF